MDFLGGDIESEIYLVEFKLSKNSPGQEVPPLSEIYLVEFKLKLFFESNPDFLSLKSTLWNLNYTVPVRDALIDTGLKSTLWNLNPSWRMRMLT